MKNISDRRNFLKAAGATLVTASVASVAAAQKDDKEEEGRSTAQPIYLTGCAWNRDLPGIFGQACFTFDVRADIGTGTGLGTLRDDVHQEVNSQIQINSVQRSGRTYTLSGLIVASRSPELVGMRVRIIAESLGDGQGRASITVESEGNNLVVIAIIGILIGLLLPDAIRR